MNTALVPVATGGLRLCIALSMLLGAPAQAAPADDDRARECDGMARKLGPESSENYVVRYFITPTAQCKDKKSLQVFCSFVQSYDGYKTLAEDAALLPDTSDPDYAQVTHVRDRAAKVCGTTTEALRASLCAKADAAKQWKYAYAECPAEGRQIYLRECQKPHVLVGEGGGATLKTSEADCARQYDARTRAW